MTDDRAAGAALLRALADQLESGALDSVAAVAPRDLNGLLRQLDGEFGAALKRLVQRFQDKAPGAGETALLGFLLRSLQARYGRLRVPDQAWDAVRYREIEATLGAIDADDDWYKA